MQIYVYNEYVAKNDLTAKKSKCHTSLCLESSVICFVYIYITFWHLVAYWRTYSYQLERIFQSYCFIYFLTLVFPPLLQFKIIYYHFPQSISTISLFPFPLPSFVVQFEFPSQKNDHTLSGKCVLMSQLDLMYGVKKLVSQNLCTMFSQTQQILIFRCTNVQQSSSREERNMFGWINFFPKSNFVWHSKDWKQPVTARIPEPVSRTTSMQRVRKLGHIKETHYQESLSRDRAANCLLPFGEYSVEVTLIKVLRATCANL